MGLREVGETLPPGFKFYPSDEELVCHYLYKKIANEEALKGTLVEVDLHVCEPWQLPEVAKLNADEWYFFSFRDRKYSTGFRTNRATTSGYWKATGKDRVVMNPITKDVVGMRKTLVFYKNRAPNGSKTGWIMHEFRLETAHMAPKEDWVLCRVFHKSKCDQDTITNKLNHQMIYEMLKPTHDQNIMSSGFHDKHQTIMITSSLNSTTSPIDHENHRNSNHPSSPSLLSLLEFQLHEMNSNTINATTEITSEVDHDYGFLWDMNIDQQYAGLDAPNIEGVRFDGDNNMIFL